MTTTNDKKDTPASYADFVAALVKPGSDIKSELTPHDCHLIHMAIGISGEAGELLDAVKKAVIYRKPLDLQNVIEEAGDILFYLTGLLDSLYVTLPECIKANRDKLSLRYSAMSYSNAQAVARADKRPPEPDEDFDSIKVHRRRAPSEKNANHVSDGRKRNRAGRAAFWQSPARNTGSRRLLACPHKQQWKRGDRRRRQADVSYSVR